MSQNIACVFPGQGSQNKGMLAELAASYSEVEATFAEASAALGYDLWDLVQNDPDDKLNQTDVTQPALLTASVAVYRVLQAQQPFTPTVLAGHSLGEYSALVCADVLTLSDAVKLVRARGEFMQTAVPAGTGAMYAIIGLDDQAIIDICKDVAQNTGEVVAAVNFNSPGQVVIAGTKNAAEQAGAACKEAGAKRALPLAVSVPSHCELMAPAAQQLADLLDTITFSTPTIPVVNNVDVKTESAVSAIKDALVRQLYCPVQWTQTVSGFAALGVTEAWEIGPGKVLTGLNKRIDKTLAYRSVNQPADLADA
ncbi:ACP S-malonyltransferase [Opacimonas viscosa]|uniref:Malonyl CoA-acyl carrier protein transacylase n=1 Tax=Opacimonas viscosa TaxID=2961944 RepID=A0AA41WZ10_9ALTE|nr:ACP S-malonyltransferase [Opacimonas viscosa]MCP3427351.1 ACP S-malonyltransferase [Opacimonas viscosa]